MGGGTIPILNGGGGRRAIRVLSLVGRASCLVLR